MKKWFLIFCLTGGLYLQGISQTQPVKRTFNTPKAGQLQSEMTAEEAKSITHLTLTGKINAKDFRLMRDSLQNLEVLDLTNATITAMTGKGGTTDESFIIYVSKCIPEYAFCKSSNGTLKGKNTLREVWLPTNTFNIEKYAFHNCRNLNLLVIQKKKAPNILTEALNDTLTAVFVPLGSKDEYRNHKGWETFNILEGIPIRANVHISIPGTLGDELLKTGNQPSDINYLTVSGTLNEADFKLIRDFMPQLVTVDLSATNATSIPEYTFSQKRYLMEITLPSNLTTIGPRAFSGCTRLGTTLTLPSQVNTIGEGAFLDCDRLQKVIVTGKNLTVIGRDLFRNDQNRLVYPQK